MNFALTQSSVQHGDTGSSREADRLNDPGLTLSSEDLPFLPHPEQGQGRAAAMCLGPPLGNPNEVGGRAQAPKHKMLRWIRALSPGSSGEMP